MRSANETLSTSGDGYWSDVQLDVKITGLDLAYEQEIDEEEGETECTFGELRVYFDTNTWDTSEHGLIYTDRKFMIELHNYLRRAGYNPTDVGYSEQGMQGDNYVSCDVGVEFIRSWKQKYAH